MKKYIAAYGTLRKDHYNFRRFDLKVIAEGIRINGYELYDLGPYPYIVKSDDSSIVVDVLECNESTFKSIRSMEIGAGYEYETIQINGLECEIYFFNKVINNTKKIPNGDYTEYKRK